MATKKRNFFSFCMTGFFSCFLRGGRFVFKQVLRFPMLETGHRAARSGEGCKARAAALKGGEGTCKHFLVKNVSIYVYFDMSTFCGDMVNKTQLMSMLIFLF